MSTLQHEKFSISPDLLEKTPFVRHHGLAHQFELRIMTHGVNVAVVMVNGKEETIDQLASEPRSLVAIKAGPRYPGGLSGLRDEFAPLLPGTEFSASEWSIGDADLSAQG